MIPENAKREIMELATEDATPLFDVTAVVRSSHPEGIEDVHVREAEFFVRSLLSKGYVKLYYDCQTKTSGRRKWTELTPAEARMELAGRANWLFRERQGADERWVTIGATEAGEKVMYRERFPA